MLSLPGLLAFLLPLPVLRDAAARDASEGQLARRRRRAVAALHLSPHLLRDAGLDDVDTVAADPRWVRRFDLDR